MIYKTHCLRGHPSKGALDVINEVLAECEKQLELDRKQSELASQSLVTANLEEQHSAGRVCGRVKDKLDPRAPSNLPGEGARGPTRMVLAEKDIISSQ